jgi:hypothetical protein
LGVGYTSSFFGDQHRLEDGQYHLPSQEYVTHCAAGFTLSSIPDQRVARYRERVLEWATWGCFPVTFVLMSIATMLIATDRQKMRLEVDAGVTVGIVMSLGAACAGLCMAGAKDDRVGLLGWLAVWSAFARECIANGALLAMVMKNARV